MSDISPGRMLSLIEISRTISESEEKILPLTESY